MESCTQVTHKPARQPSVQEAVQSEAIPTTTTYGEVETPSLQPIVGYPEPMFRMEDAAVFGMFASVNACAMWLNGHKDLFPRRYVLGLAKRRRRYLTAKEIRLMQEMRCHYGK